jgi:hypothetical protein
MAAYFLFVILVCVFAAPPSSWGATINVACPGQSLQTAIDSASPQDTINVTGTCSENILIRNHRVSLIISGGGVATVNGPDTSKPNFDVRGKAINITGFTITGGENGINVQRSANAVIFNNIIQNTGNRGIAVSQLAFAAIFDNTIQNNPDDGIRLSTGATAHIGFNFPSDASIPGNVIQNNGGRGIFVNRNSTVRAVKNMIKNNVDDGVLIGGGSDGDIADNDIDGNGGDGVFISENSFVQLGEGSGIFAPANRTDAMNLNAGFGLRCVQGAGADGLFGTLTGTSGVSSFSANCPNSVM